ncbi:DUF4190 domain-containing protein [Cellulomonas phragmiteti]|uniref:DUF4190 domain-containing protein n=1 Tax=Cellulomonas phragmiteti TaxID=478780 RepID=A0ABQ4DJF1_9CELL|nr:DUF4190 domain-containing protein [Cellulomonas phragmiteti]GIG39466.1 hypothetical protein Cph01nite_12280 [Cellulomonas phragmiteti]
MSQPHDRRPAPVYGQEGAYATYPAPADQQPAEQPPAAQPAAGHDQPTGPSSTAGPSPAAGPSPTAAPYPIAAAYPTAGPYPPGVGPYPPVGAPYRPRNDLAVWSLVLGLLGVLGCVFFTGVPAVVIGGRARRAAAAGEADNDGLAIAGIVLGWVATGLGVVVVALMFLIVLLPVVAVGLTVPFLDVAP